MKIDTSRITSGNAGADESRYPICDQMQPQWEKEGKGWITELARWYESDWALALDGGPTPSVDSVIQLIEPARQEEVRTVLESIDTRYATERRQRLSQQVDATIDSSPHNEGDIGLQSDPRTDVTMDSRPPDASNGEYEALDVVIDGSSDFGESAMTMEATAGTADSADFVQPTIDSGQIARNATSPSVIDSRKPKKIIPGYQIKKVLGRGGMGVVYLAEQEGIDRLVALKMILGGGHADQVMLDRFQAEARAIGKFQHENIVRIFDYGTHEGTPYFSLEFIEGDSLSGYLKGAPIEPIEAAKLLEPMARAMQYAHDSGVIHRDLKPANVLMTTDGVPKITDFGLAKEFQADDNLSVAGTIVGTPAYMAPEQARADSDVGPLADIYGLGAVLYCMMTGRPPFQGAKATDTLLQVIRNEPVEPIKLQPGIPKDLETICMKCLQKEKAQRYQNGGELADDLGRFIRGEPISARPISRPERVWRWCKRNPKMSIASGLAAGLALIVMIGGPTSAAVIWRQKGEVETAKNQAEANEKVAVANRVKADAATVQAVAAKEQADKNAEAASVQEKNAIDALKSLTFRVQANMAGKTDLQPLREELLTTVRNGLMRMDKNQNTARQQNMISAGIHARLGDINLEIGRADKAKEEYEKCLAIFDALAKEDAVPFPEANVSKIHQLIGDASRKAGYLQEADEHYRKSLKIRREWADKSDKNDATEKLAISLGKLGSLAQVRGDLESAEEFMQEAVSVRELLREQNPKRASAFSELMGARLVLAKIKFQQGHVAEGRTLMSEVASAMRAHAEGNPQSQGPQYNSAMFDTELGVMQLYTGDLETAEASLTRSVAAFEKLHEQLPNDLGIQQKLEEALYGLSVTYDALEQSERASQTMSRVLKMRRETAELDDTNLAYKIRLLPVLGRAGAVGEGCELASELEGSLAKTDTVRYDLACGYAQLADARARLTESDATESMPSEEALRKAAISALKDAIDAGFTRKTDLKLDPDLQPIRDMPEFKELLANSESSVGSH